MKESAPFDFGPFPILRTERLILRSLALDDAEDAFVFWGDPIVQQYNAEPLRDLGEAQTFIQELQARYEGKQEIAWAVQERRHGAVVGLVDFHSWSRYHHRAEIGYSLARASWGRGLASEAVRAVITFGFGPMLLHRIEASTIADNIRSVRMLERIGFVREGLRREYSLEDDGKYHDSALYGLLAEEYHQGG